MASLTFFPLKYLVFLPEAYLTVTLLITLFYSMFHKINLDGVRDIKYLNRFFYIGIGLIIFVLFLVAAISVFSLESIKGFFKVNNLIFIIKTIVLILTVLIILVSKEYLLSRYVLGCEYIIILFFSIVGLSLLTSCNDFLSMFLAIEFSSLPFYLLAINKKYRLSHNNAILKYFILSLICSGIMLYGISFIYGFTASTNFHYISGFIDNYNQSNLLLIFAVLLVIIGLGFKIGVAPFHAWVVDVYSGLNYSLVLLLNTVFKLVFFFVLLKILWYPFFNIFNNWYYIIYILSILSLIVGYIGALYNTNIMKIIGYSSIAQMGMALIFILNKSDISIISLIIFFIIYIVANIGIFGILMWSDLNYKKITNLEDLKGFTQKNPFYAFALSIFFLSFAGLPPLGGFFAKLLAVYNGIMAHYYILSGIAVIISILGIVVYIRIIRYIYKTKEEIDTEKIKKTRFTSVSNLVIVMCLFIILFFSICLIPLSKLVGHIVLLNA